MSSALLVMDVQRAIVDIADDGSGYLPRLRRAIEGAPGTETHPEAASRPGDVVVTKRRASAFSGSDLDVVLRARVTRPPR